MGFVLDRKPYYVWPVTFEVPADGGKWERQSFDGHFARLGQERVNHLLEAVQRRITAVRRGEPLDDDLAELTDIAIADEILIGWGGITDEDGNEVPFTAQTKARVLGVETVAAAVVSAWAESLQGSQAKKRTSRKSPGIG